MNRLYTRRRGTRRRGHVLLPVHGMAYLLVVFAPCTFFLVELLEFFKNAGAGADQPVLSLGLVLGLLCCAVICTPVVLIVLIGLPIFMGELEAIAERCGLGTSQLFTGQTRQELVAREIFRFGFLTVCAVFALLLSSLLPAELAIQGFFAAWQVVLIALFLSVVNPVKQCCPSFAGFSGDPNARYHHIF